jgi:hypothetical protein
MKKMLLLCCLSCLVGGSLLLGCKRAYMRVYSDNITEIPNADGSVTPLVTPGGWNMTYHSFGLDTSLGSMTVGVDSNKSFTVKLDDWNSVVSTNDAVIVKETLDGAANIAEKAAAAVVTSGGSSLAGASTTTLEALIAKAQAYLAAKTNAAANVSSTNQCSDGSCTTGN